jgi:hypothetical protein
MGLVGKLLGAGIAISVIDSIQRRHSQKESQPEYWEVVHECHKDNIDQIKADIYREADRKSNEYHQLRQRMNEGIPSYCRSKDEGIRKYVDRYRQNMIDTELAKVGIYRKK